MFQCDGLLYETDERGHVGQLYVYFKIVRTGRQEIQIIRMSTFHKFNVDLVGSRCPTLI